MVYIYFALFQFMSGNNASTALQLILDKKLFYNIYLLSFQMEFIIFVQNVYSRNCKNKCLNIYIF